MECNYGFVHNTNSSSGCTIKKIKLAIAINCNTIMVDKQAMQCTRSHCKCLCIFSPLPVFEQGQKVIPSGAPYEHYWRLFKGHDLLMPIVFVLYTRVLSFHNIYIKLNGCGWFWLLTTIIPPNFMRWERRVPFSTQYVYKRHPPFTQTLENLYAKKYWFYPFYFTTTFPVCLLFKITNLIKYVIFKFYTTVRFSIV